jgi:nitrogen fixation/metabolism regulation signal transduction histidine kinase
VSAAPLPAPDAPRPVTPAPRVSWWRRLEARVVAVLALLGVVSIVASAYLVGLTVRYFDALGDAQVSVARDAIARALPFYEGLVEAKREAFEARTRALAIELESQGPDRAPEVLERERKHHPDLLSARAIVGGRAVAELGAAPEAAGAVAVMTAAERGDLSLEVTYGVDPVVDARLQELGRIKREVATVAVEGGVVERDELQRAIVWAVSVASGAVLVLAFVGGFFLARSTTRRVSDISAVLRTIAGGRLDARAPPLGADEIGVLASDLNSTLDQLDQARRRVAYLQRIGAWQEMARRIAHEIKNPLTPIQLAVQQIRDKDPGRDPEFTRLLGESVEIIEDEIEGLRRMVTSFSQFARVPEVRPEPLDLRRVLEEFERAYGHLGDRAGDRLEIERAPAALPVLGDRQLLKQVLVNLVENAAASVHEQGDRDARVRVWARLRGGNVEVDVEDNGPGVAPERRERIFEPYETTREHGTGLGLSIVKKVVLDHGGEIWVDAAPDLGGARFRLVLPAAGPEVAAALKQSEDRSPSEPSGSQNDRPAGT